MIFLNKVACRPNVSVGKNLFSIKKSTYQHPHHPAAICGTFSRQATFASRRLIVILIGIIVLNKNDTFVNK